MHSHIYFHTYIQVPSTEVEWACVSELFRDKWNCFNCIGALDGKHIVIRPPANTGSYYFNYKHHFSIVLWLWLMRITSFYMLTLAAMVGYQMEVFSRTVVYMLLLKTTPCICPIVKHYLDRVSLCLTQ